MARTPRVRSGWRILGEALIWGTSEPVCVHERKEGKPLGCSQVKKVGYPYKCTERCRRNSIFLLLQNMGLAILETTNNVCEAYNTVSNH